MVCPDRRSSEGWYGVLFGVAAPGRTREYLDIVRMALSREKVSYEGKHWQLPAKEGLGLGKPLKMIGRPVQDSVPIYLGVMGEKTVKQAGQIADGWLPASTVPSTLRPCSTSHFSPGSRPPGVRVLT